MAVGSPQPISQPTNQPTNQQTKQPNKQTTNQPTKYNQPNTTNQIQPTNPPTNTTHPPTRPPAHPPANQPTHQPTNGTAEEQPKGLTLSPDLDRKSGLLKRLVDRYGSSEESRRQLALAFTLLEAQSPNGRGDSLA